MVRVQGGPLVVINGIITSMSGVITTVTVAFIRPCNRGYNSI